MWFEDIHKIILFFFFFTFMQVLWGIYFINMSNCCEKMSGAVHILISSIATSYVLQVGFVNFYIIKLRFCDLILHTSVFSFCLFLLFCCIADMLSFLKNMFTEMNASRAKSLSNACTYKVGSSQAMDYNRFASWLGLIVNCSFHLIVKHMLQNEWCICRASINVILGLMHA